MIIYLLKLFWFIIPAGVGNIFAFLSSRMLPKFNYPMDFYKSYGGIRIFGDHKTIRGLIFATISGTLMFILQQYLYSRFQFVRDISYLDYPKLDWYFGVVVSLGAILGDAVKSFFKRRINIAPGKSWFPFDQIDWILGAIVASLLLTSLDIFFCISLVIFSLVAHLISRLIGYFLKLDKSIL